MSDHICSVESCGREVFGRGWCQAHYARWRAHGDVRASTPVSASSVAMRPDERFWAKVEKLPDGCWAWTANKHTTGYGSFWDGGRTWRAHRWAFERFCRPLEDGESIDHLCRNTSCVNPDHLEAVTPMENNRRAALGGAERGQQTTTCVNGHEKSVENVYRHGTSWHCRKCRSEATARRRKAKREHINALRRELYARDKAEVGLTEKNTEKEKER